MSRLFVSSTIEAVDRSTGSINDNSNVSVYFDISGATDPSTGLIYCFITMFICELIIISISLTNKGVADRSTDILYLLPAI